MKQAKPVRLRHEPNKGSVDLFPGVDELVCLFNFFLTDVNTQKTGEVTKTLWLSGASSFSGSNRKESPGYKP